MAQTHRQHDTENFADEKLSKSVLPLKRRAWGPRRRRAQARRCIALMPWRFSTGPKGGIRNHKRHARKGLRGALRMQARYIRFVNACVRARVPVPPGIGAAVTIALSDAIIRYINSA